MSNSASHEPVYPQMRERARDLRRNLTPAEAALWRLLRDRRLAMTKWRRQVPLGRYIVDFVCFEHRLVLECDGSQHAGSLRDGVQDAWLGSQGFRVLRFWNDEVLKQRESVLATVLGACGLPF